MKTNKIFIQSLLSLFSTLMVRCVSLHYEFYAIAKNTRSNKFMDHNNVRARTILESLAEKSSVVF